MNCHEYQDLSQRLLDGEILAPSPDVEEHAATCSACRNLHARLQLLVESIRILPALVCPPDLTKRLTRLVMDDRNLRLRRLRLRVRITVSLAASILIMAVAGYFFLPIHNNNDSGPVAADPKNAGPDLKSSESPQLAQSAANARQAISTLSERMADKAKEQTKRFLAAANPIDFPDIDNLPAVAEPVDLEAAAQSLRQTGQGLADGFQPMARTARRALAYFTRELPVLQASR